MYALHVHYSILVLAAAVMSLFVALLHDPITTTKFAIEQHGSSHYMAELVSVENEHPD